MSITTELPISLTIVCILLGILYAFFLYSKNNIFNKYTTILLFSLRSIFVSSILFLLLNPLINTVEIIEEKPIVVIAQDISFSVSNDNVFTELTSLKKELSKKFEVVSLNYSDTVSSGFQKRHNKPVTNINNMLNEVHMRFSDRNLAGIIMTSDGDFNQGANPLDNDHLHSIPIYTIALGDTNSIKDSWISDLKYNDTTYLYNVSSLKVAIQAYNYSGEDLNIKLYRESELLDQKTINVDKSNYLKKISFSFKNTSLGIKKYRVVIDNMNNEKIPENNTKDFLVDVLERRQKILFLTEMAHPDIGAIKKVLSKDQHNKIDIESLSSFNKDIKEYSLIILCYLKDKKHKLIDEIKSSKISLLILTNILDPSLTNSLYDRSIVPVRKKNQESFPVVNPLFSKFDISPSLEKYTLDLPPIISPIGAYHVIDNSNVLLYQKIGKYTTKNPLILLDNYDQRKFGIVFGEGIWRWRINDRQNGVFHKNFDNLFSKITQYLLIYKNKKNRLRVTAPEEIMQDKEMILYTEYLDEIERLNNKKEVNLQLINQEKMDTLNSAFARKKNSYFLNLGRLDPGDYKYKVTHPDNFSVDGRFIVKPKNQESQFTKANWDFLSDLSNVTKGERLFINESPKLIASLFNSPLNRTILHSSESIDSSINKEWIFFFILFLLFSEWIIRKSKGSY